MTASTNGARLRFLMRRSRRPAKLRSADVFLSPANLLEERSMPFLAGPWAIALGTLTIAVVAWAAQTPLTEAVEVRAEARSSKPMHPVSVREGGRIAELLQMDGSSANAGAPILRLDTDALFEARDALMWERRALAMDVERLTALLERRTPEFDDVATARESETSLQAALFSAQQAAAESRRAVFESRIAIVQAEMASHHRLLADAQRRADAAREERSVYSRLTVNAMVPRAQLIEFDSRIDRASAEIEAQEGEIRRLDDALQDARAELAEFEAELRAELLGRRSTALQAAATLDERLSSLTERIERASVLAPVDGVLFFEQVEVAGATLADGAEVGQILPAGADLFVALPELGQGNSDPAADRAVTMRAVGNDDSAAAGHRATYARISQQGDTVAVLIVPDALRSRKPHVRPGQMLDIEILDSTSSLLEHLFRPMIAMTKRPL